MEPKHVYSNNATVHKRSNIMAKFVLLKPTQLLFHLLIIGQFWKLGLDQNQTLKKVLIQVRRIHVGPSFLKTKTRIKMLID